MLIERVIEEGKLLKHIPLGNQLQNHMVLTSIQWDNHTNFPQNFDQTVFISSLSAKQNVSLHQMTRSFILNNPINMNLEKGFI